MTDSSVMKRTQISKINLDTISIIILSSFFVLVPILRCKLFFDSYLIKFWTVQIGVAIVFIIYCYRRPKVKINKAVKYLLLGYLGINLISWLAIPSPYRSVAFPPLVAIITYILMCFLVSQYLTVPDRVAALWIFTTAGVALLGIYQYYKYPGVDHNVISTLGNENFLASHIALTFPVTIGYFWRYLKPAPARQNSSGFWRVLKMPIIKQAVILGIGIAILLIFGTVLYLTLSRGAWMGLAAGLISFGIIAGIRPGRRMLVSGIIALVVFGIAILPRSVAFIIRQFQGDVRPPIWESTINMAAMKPWFGWGKGAYFIFYPQFRITDYWLVQHPKDLTIHAHNEFLQILSETGVIGLVIFLALIIAILRIGIKKINPVRKGPKAFSNGVNVLNDLSQRYLMIGMVCGVICLLTHNLVCNNLQIHSSAIFLWLVLGLILGSGAPIPKRSGRKFSSPLLLLALIGIMAIIMWTVCIKPMVSQYLFKKGWNYRLEENWEQSIENYKRAIYWDPWTVEMHYRMAYAYVRSGQSDKALEKYCDVCRLAPDYGYIHKNMGIVYMNKGQYRLAAQCLLKAKQINPYDLQTLHNLTLLRELQSE